ncbi:hypothetical protein ACWGNY_10480 [[Kitasatospora] papulosa]|uniref:hypothetical protein n=1 Tax=[Kitasatospora] papulosa TaxID=1464011 RepID=UPI00363D9193
MSLPLPAPTYLDLAASFLGKENERWSGADTIGLHTATSELLAWVNDERRYVHRFHHSAWQSAIYDLQFCLQSIGHSAKVTIGALHDEVIRDLGSCLSDFEKPKRGALRISLQGLISLLQEPKYLSACWQDFLRACKRPEYSIHKLSKLRDEFWDAVKCSRHNAKELNTLLKGSLEDDCQAIYQAKFLLGAETSGLPVDLRDRVNKLAGLSYGDRESLCQRLVEQDPRKARHVVWIAYTSARINKSIIEAGPVRLFQGPTLRKMTPEDPNFPQEFMDSSDNYKRLFPKSDSFVMVRVDLGERSVSDAAALARKQAFAVVVAGSRHASGRGQAWKESAHQIHVMDGRIVSQTFARVNDAPVSNFQLEPLAHGIEKAAARVAVHLPLHSRSLTELLNALDLWDKAKEYDAASAILVNVRLIEGLASYTSDNEWGNFCNRVFRHHWVWSDLTWKLRNVVHDATHGFSQHLGDEDIKSIERIRERIFRDADGLVYSDMEIALECLPDLYHVYPEKELIGYELRSINRDYSSCDRLKTTRKLLIGRWDRAIARLERVRNSLTHGGPFTDETLESVSAFSRKLAGALIGCALDNALNGMSVAETMDDLAQRGEQWETNALASSTPKSFLYA